jgi:hypothetical protein
MKYNKLVFGLLLTDLMLILWQNYQGFRRFKELNVGVNGDFSPKYVDPVLINIYNPELTIVYGFSIPFCLSIIALVMSVILVVKKETFRFLLLIASILLMAFSFLPFWVRFVLK